MSRFADFWIFQCIVILRLGCMSIPRVRHWNHPAVRRAWEAFHQFHQRLLLHPNYRSDCHYESSIPAATGPDLRV